MDKSEKLNKIKNIFYPHYLEESGRVQNQKTRFAYYTTASTAFKLFTNEEVWLRNTQTMNDYMEVEYGLNCLTGAYKSESGEFFKTTLNNMHPELIKEIESNFNAWIPGFKRDTYITCFSEHAEHEDVNGRLSMWRAYGGRSGIALIFNSTPMFLETQALAAYSNPVAYFNRSKMENQLRNIANAILSEADFVANLDRGELKNIIFHMFRSATLCTKHPGFEEEKEWRVLSSPSIQESELIANEVEVIKGIPQNVLKIKLKDYPDQGLVGLEIPNFLTE